MDDSDRFMRLFVQRHDTYCLQGTDGRYTRRYAAFTKDVVAGHLLGRHTVAGDTMDRHGFTRWLCLDSDAPDGLAQLERVQAHLAYLGVLTLREASRRGGHLWLCSADAVPASLLRQVALLALQRVGVRCEVYPDREFPDGTRGVTHPVRLPLGVHQQTGRRYPFLDALGRACHGPDVASALAWLVGQPGNSIPRLRAAIAEMGVPRTPERVTSGGTAGQATGIIGWVNAHLDLCQVVAATRSDTDVRKSGKGYIGWCPWHDDAAHQDDGRPGTPSLYLVFDLRYGWSWRCLSTNCGAHAGPLHHTFDWLIWHSGGDLGLALDLARTWQQQGGTHHD
jgi:hypothetical protein